MKLKTVKIPLCKCLNTGNKIDCGQCVQPILDQDLKQKGGNNIPMSIQSSLKQKKKKLYLQQKQLRTVISCDCGNKIKMYNEKVEVKCFRCNHLWFKFDTGWEKQNYTLHRHSMTIGDAITQARNGKMVNIGNVRIKVRRCA